MSTRAEKSALSFCGFAASLTFASDAILDFVQVAQFFVGIFVQNYYLTFSLNYDIIKILKER